MAIRDAVRVAVPTPPVTPMERFAATLSVEEERRQRERHCIRRRVLRPSRNGRFIFVRSPPHASNASDFEEEATHADDDDVKIRCVCDEGVWLSDDVDTTICLRGAAMTTLHRVGSLNDPHSASTECYHNLRLVFQPSGDDADVHDVRLLSFTRMTYTAATFEIETHLKALVRRGDTMALIVASYGGDDDAPPVAAEDEWKDAAGQLSVYEVELDQRQKHSIPRDLN